MMGSKQLLSTSGFDSQFSDLADLVGPPSAKKARSRAPPTRMINRAPPSRLVCLSAGVFELFLDCVS